MPQDLNAMDGPQLPRLPCHDVLHPLQTSALAPCSCQKGFREVTNRVMVFNHDDGVGDDDRIPDDVAHGDGAADFDD